MGLIQQGRLQMVRFPYARVKVQNFQKEEGYNCLDGQHDACLCQTRGQQGEKLNPHV